MNRWVVLGIAAFAALYVLFSSMFVVNEREQAIMLRFGNIERVITEPGIYFKIPTDIVDTVQIIDDRLLRYDIADMTVQVSGGKFYIVDAFLIYRIADARLFRERALGDLRVAEDRIASRFDAALRQVYGLREFNAALSEERPTMMREARDLMRPDMAALGINIVDVRILRTDLDPNVSAQTYDRMKAERLAEAALLRARGEEAAQSLRAIADRQAVEIRATAQRDADIIRGEGDAERNAIFASAFSRDPEFFEFYRSLESYRNALATGTTMVLSPESEFFRYFGGTPGSNVSSVPAGEPISGAAPVAPATAAPTVSADTTTGDTAPEAAATNGAPAADTAPTTDATPAVEATVAPAETEPAAATP